MIAQIAVWVTILLLLTLWGLRTLLTGSVRILWTGTVKRLGLLALVTVVSLLVSPNTVEAILHPFGPGTWLAFFLFGLVGMTVLPLTAWHVPRRTLVVGANLAVLLVVAYQVVTTWGETPLPFWANWQILLETYKTPGHLLLGVGAENFLSAFTAGRPASLNMTSLWNTRFTMGSSLAFHIATVYGLAGLAAFGWLLLYFVQLRLILPMLALILLPPSFPVLIAAVALLLLVDHGGHKTPPVPRFIGILPILFATGALYGVVRAYGAELAFADSLKALQARDGTGAYNLQIQAITKNPRVTRFHIAYAQTNLALANALSAETATASATTATQLVQQAIREGKIAVTLSPTNVLAWETIAGVYTALTGSAQGADQWAVATYSQATVLDPTNPVLRLRLGGASVGRQQWDRAEESYKLAIALKPDYANAYYNLAFVYRQQKKYLAAGQALKAAITYVTSPDDVTRAQKELDELRELLTQQEKQTLDETVITPQSSDSANEPLSPLP